MRSHVIVVFGATSRIGKATIEELTSQHKVTVTVVAAVENVKDARARRLKKSTKCFLAKCNFNDLTSIQRVVRNADAVLLVPALSESGTRFSKRVIDAIKQEQVPRLVMTSSILATNDFWLRHEVVPPETTDLGYEAIEAHARQQLQNCVSLRIPPLMETVMYCHEEIMFANRFHSCFARETAIPCIAVKDVALAASRVLSQPMKKYESAYCLASAQVTCSPHEIEQLLSRALGKHVKYHQIPDERLVRLFREKGATEYVAHNMVRLKKYLEEEESNSSADLIVTTATTATTATAAEVEEREDEVLRKAAPEDKKLSGARFGYTTDFRQLTAQDPMLPTKWLDIHAKNFVRTPLDQMQLFVIGSGEGLFVEVERFLAYQVTAPTSAPVPNVGDAAIPTTSGSGVPQSKVTFCTIKSAPPAATTTGSTPASQSTGEGQDHYFQVAGAAMAPMRELLKQLASQDVVVYIPPLRLGPHACMEVTKAVVDATAKANAWGIVVVSAIFTDRGKNDSVNRMGAMELLLENSGVPYVIVRLPLFMEYFLALSNCFYPRASSKSEPFAAARGYQGEEGGVEYEEKPAAVTPTKPPRHATPAAPAAGEPALSTGSGDAEGWILSDRSLPASRQYLIAMTDAAKALVAVAYTFPLHRNRVRTLYTQCLTMAEIEMVLQSCAYKGRSIALSQVDGLHEEPGREFWKVSYWTKSHVKQFLECSVAQSTQDDPASEVFEEVTECQPITFDLWAHTKAKGYTHALAPSS